MAAPLWYGAALVLSAVVAAFFGGARERIAVLVFAALGAAWLFASMEPHPHAAAWALLVLDLGAAGWLGRIAWKAPRSWPVWALAAQAVAAAASAAYLLQPDVTAAVWLKGLLMARFAAVAALIFGTFRARAAHS